MKTSILPLVQSVMQDSFQHFRESQSWEVLVLSTVPLKPLSDRVRSFGPESHFQPLPVQTIPGWTDQTPQ